MINYKLCPGGECPKRHECQRYAEYVRKEEAGNNEPCQLLSEPQYVPQTGTCHYEMPRSLSTTHGDKVEYPMLEPLTSVE